MVFLIIKSRGAFFLLIRKRQDQNRGEPDAEKEEGKRDLPVLPKDPMEYRRMKGRGSITSEHFESRIQIPQGRKKQRSILEGKIFFFNPEEFSF